MSYFGFNIGDKVESDTEEQIENPQSKEKYVKCTNNCFSGGELILGNTYIITFEDGYNCEIKGSDNLWSKSRFIEIPNPQNLVKSSVSEPLKSNKMELLRPVLDIVEALINLEVNEEDVENMITRIESEGTKQEENKYYENKIELLEEENAELKAKIYSMNFDMCDILTIVDKYKEMK